MTEQEKRIEEMIKIVDEVFRGTLHRRIYITDTVCRILYDAGYRKEEEVRREVAKEILQKWYQENEATNFEQDYVLELAYEYGVEVEEND